ncbi:hypothetical protein [Metallosphaera hakonensis]|uniref:hypothetical protein n=1 Tax=Metallosphaera hakonensis TaxID=79601 RepID=UPI0006D117B8|nr:hypothetical protein [Metallosphaera hakonensis]
MTGVTNFAVIPQTNSVDLDQGTSTTIYLDIEAYGTVSLSVTSPNGISVQYPGSVNVQGSDTIPLTISDSAPPGSYSLVINASLFPGFYKAIYIPITVASTLLSLNLGYSVNGEAPPSTPTITLSFPNGTSLSIPLRGVVKVPPGTEYQVQQSIMMGNTRWSTDEQTTGVISSSGSLTLVYYEQYLVTFNFQVQGGFGYSVPTFTYTSFGQTRQATAPTTVWADVNSNYQFPAQLQSQVQGERWVTQEGSGTVSSPGNLTVYYQNQYYLQLSSPIPVYALINGENSTLLSGWFDQGTTIQVENITYYVTPGEREVMTGVSTPLTFTVNFPEDVRVSTVTQYYLQLSSPIPVYALINGENSTLLSGWFDQGTTIQVENITYYVTPGEREVISRISPGQFILNSSTTITVKTFTQYFVNVTSPIPVKAYLNNSEVTLTPSWINAGTSIRVINYTYNVSPQERLVIVKVNPESSITLTSPLNLSLVTVKQYLVSINGVSKFLNQGTIVKLNASVPFYDVAHFEGTYNVPAGTSLLVNQSVTEVLVITPNYPVVVGIPMTAIVVGLAIFLWRRSVSSRSHKGGQPP